VFIAHKLTVCILVYAATTYPLHAYCGFRYRTMPRAYVPDLHGVVRIPVTLTQSILLSKFDSVRVEYTQI